MTARRLKATVYIDGKVFGPTDDVPKKYADQIGDHAWVDAPAAAGGAEDGEGPPPQAGKGSSEAAWASYAAGQGVDLPAGAKRDDIIAALTTAGVPVE